MIPGDAPRRRTIAVIGDAHLPENSPKEALAEELGRCLIDEGYILITGGMGGVMAAACRGARSSEAWSPGVIVGLLPGHDPTAANPWVDVVIPTGLDIGRNSVVVHADAVIAIGGGAGTLSEMALAWQLHRLILAFRVDGWSKRLADKAIDARQRYPDRPDDLVLGVDSPDEALDLVSDLLCSYERVHGGVR